MCLNDLIREKDYDCIELRMVCRERKSGSIFYGRVRSENGKLVSPDGDNFDEELFMKPVSLEEWVNKKKNIKNGLTVVFQPSLVKRK